MDFIWLPNACGIKYAVAFTAIRGARRHIYLRRDSVVNWCMLRREWPIFPTPIYATVSGDYTGVVALDYNGAYYEGSVATTTPAGTLYLRQG
jgi:hypothetical protein